MKVILCGYHWAGCKVLEHLCKRDDVSQIFVYTHTPPSHIPDIRNVGRRFQIPFSVQSINKGKLPFSPDIITCVYYRYILKKEIISACSGKAFNMHPSLLPRHRGCSSIPWAIIEGDTITGVTFHYIDEGIDTGNVVLQAAIEISSTETQASLYQKCMEKGVCFWPAAFELVMSGFTGLPQEGTPSYHPRGCPFEGMISEEWDNEMAERFIRAMIFPPLPPARYSGKLITSFSDYLALRESKS